jgi:hypothetical protein
LLFLFIKVELYSKEKYENLMKNNSPVHIPTSDPPKSPTVPAGKTDTAIYAVPQKRRAPPPPSPDQERAPPLPTSNKRERAPPPPVPPPAVGEDRLDHMKKMKELKPVMPLLETGYYDQVNRAQCLLRPGK